MASILKGCGTRLMRLSLEKTRTSRNSRTQWNISSKSVSTTSYLLSNSNSNIPDEDHKVVITNDGRVIVCWHPEVPCPYELTKPVPVETNKTHPLLKVQALLPVREIFRPRHEREVVNELMSLTYTPKYTWFPKRRRERYREMNPLNEKRDREGL